MTNTEQEFEVAVRRVIRRDRLPEHSIYDDDGCEVAPRCLQCPLPQCKYDAGAGSRRLVNGPRDSEIRQLRADGAKVKSLAQRFSLTQRSIFRILGEGH